MKKRVWKGLACSFALLTALGFVAGQTMESYSTYVDQFFKCQSQKIVTEDGELYDKFVPDQKYLKNGNEGNSKALIADAIRLGAQVGAEGTVLLKNDGVLPFASGKKVSLLGARSATPLLGAGMGVQAQGTMISLEDGLSKKTTNFKDPDHVITFYNRSPGRSSSGDTISKEDAAKMDEHQIDGGDMIINPHTFGTYKSYNASLGDNALTNNDSVIDSANVDFNPFEPSVADLKSIDGQFEQHLKEYNDYAVVTIGRPSSETNDYWKGKVEKGLGITEPLQITSNELEIIELAKATCNKVVVLINSASPMDIDALKHDEKIGAICYIGQPGTYGMLGVAQVLTGKVAPSGKLVDTFAANQLSAPAMMNFGDYTYANADQANRTTTIGGANTSKKYVIEAEGIYTGYKYYETRYEDVVLNQGNASSTKGTYASKGGWDYDKEVSYAFGYGMSTTTFEQKITKVEKNQTSHDYSYDLEVEVKNTGKVAAKEVVQVYGQAPYKKGGIEKSSIQLLAFEKTDTLEPGKSETLKIHVDLQNLASYDEKHDNGDGTKGTYVLESGDYYLSIGNGAHEALNNVLAAKGKLQAGKVSLTYKFNQSYDDYDTFRISKNGYQVSNQIQYGNWNYYDDNEVKVTYLSRSDWDKTYPIEYKNMKAGTKLLADLNGNGPEYYTTHENEVKVKWGQATDLQLASMTGSEWDDPRWNEILDALTLEEAILMVMYGGPNLAGAPSIQFPKDLYLTENSGSGIVLALGASEDKQAPWTIAADDNNAGWKGGVFANAPTTAASFNKDLWKEIGEFIGNECLFTGIPFLWGPGLNTHRSSYNGRTGEYYSEDGVLAGEVAMEYSMGAIQKGLVASPKHFAFNDQETNRAGVSPFMTEQRARETELRAYQIAVEMDKYDKLTGEDCGMRGVMTSFSKIGGVEVTCSYGMMTEILQNEWGFHGYAVTDIYDDTDLFDSVAASGVVCYDLRGQKSTSGLNQFFFMNQAHKVKHAVDTYAKDGVLQERLKLAAKNLLWIASNSMLVNRFNLNSKTIWVFTPWRAMYIIGTSLFALLSVTSVAMYVVSALKKEEK